MATIDRRADVVRTVAARRGWRLVLFTATELAGREVPHPSAETADRVGTPSVAEAAALLAAGPAAEIIVPKRVYPCVTVAVSRGVLVERSDA